MAWDDMVIMVNGLLAEQAMSVLLCVHRILHGTQSVQRTLLVFPPMDIGIIHRHESKAVEFHYHLRDR